MGVCVDGSRRERKTPKNTWGLAGTPVAQRNSMPGEGLLCWRQHPLRNFPGRGVEGSRSRNLEVPGQQKGKGEGPSLQEDREDWGLTRNKGAVPRPVSPQLLAGGKRGKNGDDGLPWWLSGGESACVQETQVPSLVPEDPTCSRATSLCTSTTELVPRNHNHRAPAPQREVTARKSPHITTGEQPPLLQLEKNLHRNEDPAQPIKK